MSYQQRNHLEKGNGPPWWDLRMGERLKEWGITFGSCRLWKCWWYQEGSNSTFLRLPVVVDCDVVCLLKVFCLPLWEPSQVAVLTVLPPSLGKAVSFSSIILSPFCAGWDGLLHTHVKSPAVIIRSGIFTEYGLHRSLKVKHWEAKSEKIHGE